MSLDDTPITVNASGDGYEFDIIPQTTSPGGILTNRDFITEYEGAIRIDTLLTVIVELELKFIHYSGVEGKEFETSRVHNVRIHNNEIQTIPLSIFNSRTQLSLGTRTLADGSQITITQEDLDNDVPIKLTLCVRGYDPQNPTTRLAFNLRQFKFENVAANYRQDANIGGPPVEHGDLVGLSDNDHPQYVLHSDLNLNLILNTLNVRGIGDAKGIWGNFDTNRLYVAAGSSHIFVFDLTTANRVVSEEFSPSLDPEGIWGDGTTLWIVDDGANACQAYTIATGERNSSLDINISSAGNNDPEAIWANDDYFWIADNTDDRIYAYDRTTRNRVSGQEIVLPSGIEDPRGLWGDGTTLYIADHDVGTIFAYTIATRQRNTLLDIPYDRSTYQGAISLWGDNQGNLYVGTDSGEILVYDIATKSLTRVLDHRTRGINIKESLEELTGDQRLDGSAIKDRVETDSTLSGNGDIGSVLSAQPTVDQFFERRDNYKLALHREMGADGDSTGLTIDGDRTTFYQGSTGSLVIKFLDGPIDEGTFEIDASMVEGNLDIRLLQGDLNSFIQVPITDMPNRFASERIIEIEIPGNITDIIGIQITSSNGSFRIHLIEFYAPFSEVGLDNLKGVRLTAPLNNQVIAYDAVADAYINKALTASVDTSTISFASFDLLTIDNFQFAGTDIHEAQVLLPARTRTWLSLPNTRLRVHVQATIPDSGDQDNADRFDWTLAYLLPDNSTPEIAETSGTTVAITGLITDEDAQSIRLSTQQINPTSMTQFINVTVSQVAIIYEQLVTDPTPQREVISSHEDSSISRNFIPTGNYVTQVNNNTGISENAVQQITALTSSITADTAVEISVSRGISTSDVEIFYLDADDNEISTGVIISAGYLIGGYEFLLSSVSYTSGLDTIVKLRLKTVDNATNMRNLIVSIAIGNVYPHLQGVAGEFTNIDSGTSYSIRAVDLRANQLLTVDFNLDGIQGFTQLPTRSILGRTFAGNTNWSNVGRLTTNTFRFSIGGNAAGEDGFNYSSVNGQIVSWIAFIHSDDDSNILTGFRIVQTSGWSNAVNEFAIRLT